MRFDPDKLVRQRQALGYSQETVAALAKVGVRTVQRAEAGDPLKRDNMADIAAALKLPLHALLAAEEEEEGGASGGVGAGELVTLRRAASARELFELIDESRLCRLDCDVDPTPETLPALAAAIETIEPWLPDPWEDRPRFPSLVARLETIARLDAAMARLSEIGLALFIGRRVELAVMPIAFDEGYSTRRNQRPERVTTGRILIGQATPETRSVAAAVDWPVEVVREPGDVSTAAPEASRRAGSITQAAPRRDPR